MAEPRASNDTISKDSQELPKTTNQASSEDVEKAGTVPVSAESTQKLETQAAANSWAADFPEGGTKAWLTVAGGSACLFVSFGWVNCIGVFQDYCAENQLRNYTQSQISWIPALQSK